MELEYVLMDPTGNVTALVKTPAPPPRQPALALALMELEPTAEQVGFLSPGDADADVALRMAGGEFCGNATMCAAALFSAAHPSKTDVLVRCSGASAPLRVSLTPERDGVWRCCERLTERPTVELVTLPLAGASLRLPLVRVPGIAHLILPGGLDRERVAQAAPDWCDALGAEALGCMLLDEDAGRLTPLVFVPEAQTLYWENSCASGSAAVGAYLARRRGRRVSAALVQPGGTLYVDADPVGEITLRGAVRELKVGKIIIE